jgi:phosphoribosyl 1,2-cyclic phosphodiesterase
VDPADRLTIRFWGVRGSLPAPGPTTVRYGGETTCLEVMVGPERVIVDCGSGARWLGLELMREGATGADLLFTHSHMDHICGLPFFVPAYDPNYDIRLWAGHVASAGAHQDILERLMSPPIFPVPTAALKACRFRSFHAGQSIELPSGVRVDTVRLNHPGGSTGYRFEKGGRRLCIITDHEHGDPDIDAAVAAFVEGSDVMVYDAMYTESEYPKRVGWGHSTWQEALALAARAHVRRTVIFHHDPIRSDDDLDRLDAEVRDRDPGAMVAREGLVLDAAD